MANSIAAGMNDTVIAQAALNAFTSALTPLTRLTTNFSSDIAVKSEQVNVPFVPAQDAAANFAGSYTIQDADVESKPITLNKHKFVGWGLTDTEVSKSPILSLELFGAQKGYQLAKAVFQDILSIVTAANYGAASHTGAAATLDADAVATLSGVCDVADMPEMPRSLVLSSTYWVNLLKDNAIQASYAFGGPEAIRKGQIPSLVGFDMFKSNLIPANGENLVGFAAHPNAIGVAMRYLAPQAGNKYSAAEAINDPESGITLGLRTWYDEDSGQARTALECFYGYALLNGSALKRIVSA